jgi:aspartyl-tRNA(Asn)/glutamyl-tRNA(Gln) amidotransferase subunit A
MRELLMRNGHELLGLIESGEVDHVKLQEEQFQFAKQVDEQLNAFISWDEELESQEWDLPLMQDGPRQLQRLPYAVKDIFATQGLQSTAGSRILEGYVPPYDATCVAHLRFAKNHLMGKTNLDEFAMGSSGEMSAYGVTRNPWHLDYVPGGSSSGSATAVAACQCVMALGTDTGGSVRQPASFCGIVGYRPTYGLISRYGLIAYSSSCDQAGIFARCSLDTALTMNTVSKPDPRDSTSLPLANVDYFTEAQRDVHWNKLRVGVLKQLADKERIDQPVLENFQASLKAMSDAGAQIVELEFPLVDYILPAYYIITAAECSSNLARYDGIRFGIQDEGDDLLERYIKVRSEGFGAEVKRRILLGTYVLSTGYYDAYYDRARQLRRDIREGLEQLFSQADVLVTPTSPCLPFQFGEKLADPVQMYLADLCTVFVNLAGTGGISLPNGFGERDGDRLPTGIQFVCAPFRDNLLLRVAHQFEQLTGWQYEPPAWIKAAASE